MANEIDKTKNATGVVAIGKPKIGGPRPGSLADRIRKAEEARGAQSEAGLEVIQLLLDCSRSMGSGDYDYATNKASPVKIDLLRAAVQALVREVDLSKYMIGLDTFPAGIAHSVPVNIMSLINLAIMDLTATGGTPMGECIEAMLAQRPLPNRCILVSDGENTGKNPGSVILGAKNSETAKVPMIDCVHIGSSSGGEATLKEIAKLTGGLYLKFTDLNAFQQSFKYLAPQYRALLAEGKIETGATK